MPARRLFTAIVILLSSLSAFAQATPGEMQARDQWVAARFGGGSAALPISFSLGGAPSTTFLKTWKLERAERKLDGNRTEITLTCTDPASGLSVRCVAVQYRDFPAIEWTPYFKNSGSNATPIIADIRALDTTFERTAPGEFVLDHSVGSNDSPGSYEPRTVSFGRKMNAFKLAPFGGRASNWTMPYWKITWGDGGAVIAVGWPGQWSADFNRVGNNALRIRAGQELTHFKLEPGEEVRAPLVAMLFWQGDQHRGHNLWRAWMLAANLPRVDGKLLPTQLVACSSHQYNEMQDATEANQIGMIDRYLAEKLPLRYWWMDAGWYVNNGTWKNTGTWEVDKKRFPKGLRAITDHGRAKGVKSIVWFEPERVTPDSWIFKNHPEWCFEQEKIPVELKSPLAMPPPPHGYHGVGNLFNFGDPKAWEWMVNHVDKIITEEGIDLYRQDFNLDPLPFWRANDSVDRQGITEIRYVSGLLAYWDELRRRHPNLFIDVCASGGRRIDLESLRRGYPLLRDDTLFEPNSQQGHTHGISFWIPYHGTGSIIGQSKLRADFNVPAGNLPDGNIDVNLFRSLMAPTIIACWDVRRTDLDYDSLRRLSAQFERVAPYYTGDYYPLTNYSLSRKVWMAWQFDRPDLGEGMVQVFRREESPFESARFKLYGLVPTATYVVENLDGGSETRTGADLMASGLPVAIATQPAALVFAYKRVK